MLSLSYDNQHSQHRPFVSIIFHKMNILDPPDDLHEDIARSLDEKAVAAMRAASHATAASRLVLANPTHAAYFALCQNDADQFHAIMPQYLGRCRGRRTRMNRLAAITLYAQLTTCLVRGNIGFPGRSWALLNAWSHDAGLMTERLMRELMQLALSRGASRALVALLKYRGMNAIQLSNANRPSAFFRHPRMIGDPLRAEIALHLSLPLAQRANSMPDYAQGLMQCDSALALAYLSALDNGPASVQLVACILERGSSPQEPNLALLDIFKDAYDLSRREPPHLALPNETLELARARLEAHVHGDSHLAQRLVDWMARVGASLMQRALLGILSNSIVDLQLATPAYLHWAARYLARDTALQASRVHHAVAQGLNSLPSNGKAAKLVTAYLRGFPIDLTHAFGTVDPLDCPTCQICAGDETKQGQPWFVRTTPATDLDLALARRTADAALHTLLAQDPNAAHRAWIRVLNIWYLNWGALFRAWGELHRSETQLLVDAGVVPLESTCGLGGAGIHLATLVSVYLNRVCGSKSLWQARFAGAVAAAREVWPEVVAGWRVDALFAQQVQASVSALRFPLTDQHLHNVLEALAKAEIPADMTPEEFLAFIKQ
ncbi:hypothetical protein BC828DRAFT_431298 [Blastocladiella britannica]|nr:hypothetical protein BC828DRAFT_431298 [Blastocladiella britannica]